MLQVQATGRPVPFYVGVWFGFCGANCREVFNFHAVLSLISSAVSEDFRPEGPLDHVSIISLKGHRLHPLPLQKNIERLIGLI